MDARDMISEVKAAAKGQWGQLIPAVTGRDASLFEGQHGRRCPNCGGDDRFAPFRDFAETGGATCRGCFRERCSDGIAVIAWLNGCSMIEAAKTVDRHLGLGLSGGRAPACRNVDTLSSLAADKGVQPESLKAYGASRGTYGRQGIACVRFPGHGGDGQQKTVYSAWPGDKGRWAKGGGVGLFMVDLPKPGESVVICEGLWDAARLWQEGCKAVGRPGSVGFAEFAPMFRGVHVIVAGDLDAEGQRRAQSTARQLLGIAASVRIARLPGEIKASKGPDVRDCIRKHGVGPVLQAVESAVEVLPAEIPEIELLEDESIATKEVAKAIGRFGWTDRGDYECELSELTFVGSRGLVQIIEGERHGMHHIRPVPFSNLRVRITQAARLLKRTEEGTAAVQPPRHLVDAVAELGQYPDKVKRLRGISYTPIMRSDGSVFGGSGYDRRTRLMLLPDTDFPSLPSDVSRDDAARAAEKLLSLIHDFPAVDGSHRSAWLAYTLSLVCRSVVDGPVPLFVADASCAGSGKTLLIEIASLIATGRPASLNPMPAAEDELRKLFTSACRRSATSLVFDNVSSGGMIGGRILDQALTSRRWTDRILGKSEEADMEFRAVLAATGNNVSLAADTARRSYLCRLEPQTETPESREDFRVPDLRSHVAERRGELVVAALTVVAAYIRAGRPQQGVRPMGSFESWSGTIRSAIVWAGFPDPLAAMGGLLEKDSTASDLGLLLDGLQQADPDGLGLTGLEIARMIERPCGDEDPIPLLREAVGNICGAKVSSRSIGCKFRSFLGRISGGRRLTREEGAARLRRWKVETVSVLISDNGDSSDNHSRCLTRGKSSSSTNHHVSERGELEGSSSSPPSSPAPLSSEDMGFDFAEELGIVF